MNEEITPKSETESPTAERPVGKTRIQQKNEGRLLDAAQEAFAARGYGGTSLDEIARRAGMSKPNLLYYYKSKSDLYLAVLRRILDVWLAPLIELDPNGDPYTQLRHYISRKLELSRDNPTASRVFAGEILQGAPLLSDYLAGDLRNLVARKAKVINAWVKDGKIRPVEPRQLIFLIWAATQHYADFAPQVTAVLGKKELSSRDFKKIEATLCDLIFEGLRPR